MYKLLTTADSREWSETLTRFEDSDIYFTPQYHSTFEANGDGEASAFVFQRGDDVLLHPFMKQSISRVGGLELEGEWRDIQSVYGYSGPLATTEAEDFLEEAFKAFHKYCLENNIVAEFIRFNPLLGNQRFISRDYRVIHPKNTVEVSLNRTSEELWSSYPSVQRNMVRKAQKAGLEFELADLSWELLTEFRRLYEETMQYVGAKDYYYFSESYYRAALNELNGNMKIGIARLEGETAAAALIMYYGDKLHYHLSAADTRYRSLAGTNLILHSTAEWGLSQGFQRFHLGGGRGNNTDDSLLKFKLRISPEQLPIYLGMKVHLESKYDELCDTWLERMKPPSRPDYFLLYRM